MSSSESIAEKLGDVVICIDHVGFAVSDLESSLKLYTEQFGFRLIHREINKDMQIEEAMLVVGEHSSESITKIQLICPLNENSPIDRFLVRHGQGLQQIAYRVKSIDEACRIAEEQGFKLVYPRPRLGTMHSKINFIHPKSAGGVLVELVEIAPVQLPL